jgi:hypothetical protein
MLVLASVLFLNTAENPMFHGFRRGLKGFTLIIFDFHRGIDPYLQHLLIASDAQALSGTNSKCM